MQELGEAELSSAMLALLQYWPLLFSQSLHFDWPDAIRSHQKVVEEMSKSWQKLLIKKTLLDGHG